MTINMISGRSFLMAGAGFAALMTVHVAAAQTAPQADTVTTNLIRLLVKQKIITRDAGEALLAQAIAEARSQQAAAAKPAPAASAPATSAPAAEPGTLRVGYVPEIVKKQISAEIQQQVMAQAKAEGWAAPKQVAEWTQRITFSGDVRVRSQSNFYSKFNSGGASGALVDYAKFNANGPVNLDANFPAAGSATAQTVPYLNSTSNSANQLNVRARFGITALLSDHATAGIRIATGASNSPVSTNQSLGGGLAKKDLWLDQAWIKLQPWQWASLTAGRMANPFFSTELVYDADLNFDGVAAQLNSADMFGRRVKFTVTGGAFPLEFNDETFPDTSFSKSRPPSKWLFAGQIAADVTFSDAYKWKLAAAYYNFRNVQGQFSSPCDTSIAGLKCDTDPTRPAFMQKGNTVFLLRNPSNAALTAPNTQYVGLMFPYRLLNLTSEMKVRFTDRYTLVLTGDYVKNLAYQASDVCRVVNLGGNAARLGIPLTNGGSDINPCDGASTFQSGSEGWMAMAQFGVANPRQPGDWNFAFGYKRVEPDAVLDGYTDSDFHLGGTNAKGYFLSGSLGLFNNIVMKGRWLSANEVYGPPLSIDVLQLDLNASF